MAAAPVSRYSKRSNRDFLQSLGPAAQRQIAAKLGYDPLKKAPAANTLPAPALRTLLPLETRPASLTLVCEGFIAKSTQGIRHRATLPTWQLATIEKRRCYDAVRRALYDAIWHLIWPWPPYDRATLTITRFSPKKMDETNLATTKKYVEDALLCVKDGCYVITDDNPDVLLKSEIIQQKEGGRKATVIEVVSVEDSG